MSSVPAHVTPLRLVQRTRVDVDGALRRIVDEAPEWLGTPVPAPREGSRRFLTDLVLPLRDRAPGPTFSKAAYVDLGTVHRVPEGQAVDIGWRSSSLAPLFPVFAGQLTITPTELRLEGYYAPPGGEFGVILDRAFLHIAARGTAKWFLARAVSVVEGPIREAGELAGQSRTAG